MVDILAILSSSGLGAITGVIGGLAQKFVDIKAKKLEYSHSESMRKIDVAESRLERDHELLIADKKIDMAESEGDISIRNIEAVAFNESQKMAGVNPFLTYIRAAITLYLLLAASALTTTVWYQVGGLDSFTADELKYLLNRIVEACLFLTTTCVTWWFAARSGNMRFNK